MALQPLEETRIEGSGFFAVENLTSHGAMTSVTIMSFAFTGQFMLAEIMAEMKNLEDFPRAYLLFATPFMGIAFLVCGLGGYYFRGNLVEAMIIDQISFGPAFRVVALCLIVHMVITWVIKGMVFCRLVHQYIDPIRADSSSEGWFTWFVIVACSVAIAGLVAQLVPFFVDFVDLLGASLTPLTCYLIPLVCYLVWLRDFGSPEDYPGRAEMFIILLEIVFSVVVIVVGTFMAVQNIIKSWETYGYPFSCLCQNVWNTCECSSSHAGMEHCNAPKI
jgi:hypothetical protein